MAHWGVALSLLNNPHSPPSRAEPAARARRHPEGQGDRRQDPARARLHRRARGHVRRSRQAHRIASASAPSSRRWRRWRRNIRTTTKRRSPTPSRSTPRRRRRQDLCPAAQGRGDPRADLQAPAAASRRDALPDPPLRLSGDRARRGSTPPTATPRSRRRRRMRSTCPRTSTPASAIGRSRSPPTPPRRRPPRPTRKPTTSCTARTTWSMPICSSARTRRRAPSSTR